MKYKNGFSIFVMWNVHCNLEGKVIKNKKMLEREIEEKTVFVQQITEY